MKPDDPTPRETPASKFPPAPVDRLVTLDGLPAHFGSLTLAWDNYLKYLTMRPKYL